MWEHGRNVIDPSYLGRQARAFWESASQREAACQRDRTALVQAACELAPHGIRVNSVAPTGTDTVRLSCQHPDGVPMLAECACHEHAMLQKGPPRGFARAYFQSYVFEY